MKTQMTTAQKSASFFGIMQLFSTARLDATTEQRIIRAIGVDDMTEAFRELKKQEPETLIEVQKIIGPRYGNGAKVENPGKWLLKNGQWIETR